jgi:hypothetical protein
MVTGVCHAYTAADYAVNPPYSAGWSAGQNGGYGLGPWSFNGTDPSVQQGMSSTSPLGNAWTMFNVSSTSGIACAGRAIPGGMYVGQTLEMVVQNPTTYHFYRGFDIGFTPGSANDPGGVNTANLRLDVFGYTFTGSLPNWNVTDAGGTTTSSLSPYLSAQTGMRVDLTLTSGSTYSLTMTPLSNPAAAYSQSGNLAGPINWVQFRLYNTTGSGLEDPANDFRMSYITITPEPSSMALLVLGASGLVFFRRRK